MRCEVCGRKIHGKSYNVMIDGAELTVCGRCARYGKIVPKTEKPPMPRTGPPSSHLTLKPRKKKPPKPAVESILELVENFHAKIRQARRKLKLSHEDLGRKISEKVSVIKKVEKGKMTPDHNLATKFEHALKIKLLIQASDEKFPQAKLKPESRARTLGDVIQLDKKKASEEKAERKQS